MRFCTDLVVITETLRTELPPVITASVRLHIPINMGQCTSRQKKKKIRRENEPAYAEPMYLAMGAYNPNNATSLVDDDITSQKYLEMRDYAHRNESSSNDDNMALIDIGNAYAVSSPLSAKYLHMRDYDHRKESNLNDGSRALIYFGDEYAVCPPLSSTSHASDSMEASSRDKSNILSTDSAYSDEISEEHKSPKIATKTNVSSLENNAPFGENCPFLSHDLESMVDIFRAEIEETVDTTRILTHLSFISRSDEDEILQAGSESSVLSMKKLIDKIKTLKEEGKWEAFVMALECEGYKCIVQDLRGVPQEDYLEKRKLVQAFASPLIRQIDTYEIAQHLYMKGVISQSDKEVIERNYSNYGRMQGARKLLQCLHHCSSNWFEQFCDTLKECGHHDLLELLSPETTKLTERKKTSEADTSLFYLTPIFSEPEAADNGMSLNLSMDALDKTVSTTIRRDEEKPKMEKELLESVKELNITIAELEESINRHSYRGQEEHQGETTDRKKQADIWVEMYNLITGLPAYFAEELKPIHRELAAIKSEIESLKGQLAPSLHPRWHWHYRPENCPVSSSGYVTSYTEYP